MDAANGLLSKGTHFDDLRKKILVQEVMIMKRAVKNLFLALALTIAMILSLTGCGGNGNSIVGTWNSDDGKEVLIFEKDGTCSVPFTYDGGWLESCDRYVIDDDGMLVLSSSKGNIDSERYTKQDSREAVEENGGYFLSGDTLVLLDFRTVRSYTRQ